MFDTANVRPAIISGLLTEPHGTRTDLRIATVDGRAVGSFVSTVVMLAI